MRLIEVRQVINDVLLASEFSTVTDMDAETIALFSGAAAVVGVHGGALANIVFCAKNTLIVELGFDSNLE